VDVDIDMSSSDERMDVDTSDESSIASTVVDEEELSECEL
jgi:hypothetical protein